MRQLGIVFVFGLGVGVGCAAGSAVQTQVAQAEAPEAGSWNCFGEKGEDYRLMRKRIEALNANAAHVPAGTIVPLSNIGFCVKH